MRYLPLSIQKTTSFACLLLIIAVACNESKKEPRKIPKEKNPEKLPEKPEIKKWAETVYIYDCLDACDTTLSAQEKWVKVYDQNNQLLEEIYYTNDTVIDLRVRYSYLPSGQLNRIEHLNHLGSVREKSIFEFFPESHMEVRKDYRLTPDKEWINALQVISTYSEDSLEKRQEAIQLYPEQGEFEESVTLYNPKGQILEQNNGKGNVEFKAYYNHQGQDSLSQEFSRDGNLSLEMKSTYKNSIKTTIIYDPDIDLESKQITRLDASNRPVEVISYDPFGDMLMIKKYSYTEDYQGL